MAKTYQTFYNEHVGKVMDYDGVYGCQCVDGFKVFCAWGGISVKTTGNGYADGYWYNRNKSGYSKYFYFVPNGSTFRNGDWVIWARGSKSHPNSHIAMYYNGKEFGENQGGNRGFRLINGHFSDALGAFRWKQWSGGQDDTAGITTSATAAKAAKSTNIKTTEKAEDAPKEETVKEQKRVTIQSVNSGKDYLESLDGIKLFGRVSKVVTWDDVTKPENLKTKAQQALNNAISMAVTLEVDAVDASLLDFKTDSLRLGDLVEVQSPPHGLDTMLRLSKMSLPLDKPQDASYTLGASFTALTEQQVAQKREAYAIADRVRQVSVITEEITNETMDKQDYMNVSDVWIEVTEGG